MLTASDENREPSILDVPCYKTHPVVRRAVKLGEAKPLPLGIYCDAVRFQCQASGRNESVTGFWLINLLTSTRHFFGASKSMDTCSCGCRGWCTTWPMLDALRWCLETMQEGLHPARHYDGSAWTTAAFANVAGTPLGWQAVLVYVKGDWAEAQHTLGLPSWQTSFAPCQFCSICKAEMFDFDHLLGEPDGPPWPAKVHEDYDASCRRCELEVDVATAADRALLCQATHWIRPKTGMGGRVVKRDLVINGVRLLQGDRVVPSVHLKDMASLDRSPLPVRVTLWRARKNASDKVIDDVNNRCPIFATALHASPARSLCVDSLHAVMLGVALRWCGAATWRILLKNSFGVRGTLNEVFEIGIARLKSDLNRWEAAAGVPNNRRLGQLTLKMCGPRGKWNLQDATFTFTLLTYSRIPVHWSTDVGMRDRGVDGHSLEGWVGEEGAQAQFHPSIPIDRSFSMSID